MSQRSRTSLALIVCTPAICLHCGGSAVDDQRTGQEDERADSGESGGGTSGDGDAGDGPANGGALGTGGSLVQNCEAPGGVAGVQALFLRDAAARAGGTEAFFHFPWPEISRPLSELAAFPNPPAASGCEPQVTGALAGQLVSALPAPDYRSYLVELSSSRLEERARHPGIFIAFDGEWDDSNLPTPVGSLDYASPVLLMNVDASSGQRGALTPIISRKYTGSHYLPNETLAVLPAVGFPLLESTRYALIVRRDLMDAAGHPLGSSAEFEARKLDDCEEPYEQYLEVFEYLENEQNIRRGEIAAMTVFDTGAPTFQVESLREEIEGATNAPALASVAFDGPAVDETSASGYHLLTGTYEGLIQQRGQAPHLPTMTLGLAGVSVELAVSDVGEIIDGPIARTAGGTDTDSPRTEAISFALSIPDSALSQVEPVLPLVIYAPGTGANVLSPMNSGVAADLASLGYALLSTTPTMHQERAHKEALDSELRDQLASIDALLTTTYEAELDATIESGSLFFNPLNLQAARGNVIQAAVDYAWQAKVFSEVSLQALIDGSLTSFRFDAERIHLLGHSQGAGVAPLLSRSDDIGAMVLSGTSGHTPSTVVYKTSPEDELNIASMIEYLVCDEGAGELDVTHPFLSLMGHWFEPADAELTANGFAWAGSMSVFAILGRDDTYAPPQSNHAIVGAARLLEVTPPEGVVAFRTNASLILDTMDRSVGYANPLSELGASGTPWGEFRQYHDTSCSDDHFVFTCNPQARADWLAFFSAH